MINDRTGTDRNCGHRNAAVRALILLPMAALFLAACADLPDDPKSSEAAVITYGVNGSAFVSGTYGVDLGSVQRVVGYANSCNRRCTKYHFGTDIHQIQCLNWVPDCTQQSQFRATLHADAGAAASGTIFPGFNEGPTWQYSGCGPQAAQNVLNYYGVQMLISDIEQYIPTFGLIAGAHDQSIATFPDDLATGLQHLLDDNLGANQFVVSRRSGVNVGAETMNALNTGNPIIILVQGGSHFQVATGYAGKTFVLDYPGKDHWQDDLQTKLDFGASLFSTVSFGAGGFEDDTVITIKHLP